MKPLEWIVTCDNDCNQYIIPFLRRADWGRWLHSEECMFAEIPDWAMPVDDDEVVVFENWRLL